MSATDYLYRTLGSLRNLWPAGKPHTFMDHEVSESMAIADHMLARGLDEFEVAQFIDVSCNHRKVKFPEFIGALRKLSDAGSRVADQYRNTGAALQMGDRHDMVGDYELAAVNYILAYLHNDDRGFMHMAKEIEGRNARRDADGYADAIYWLAESEGDPAQSLQEMQDIKLRTNLAINVYPEEYYQDLIKVMNENSDIRKAARADFLVYRAAAAVRLDLDRSRAWKMHLDGLQEGPTDQVFKNPYIRDTFVREPVTKDI